MSNIFDEFLATKIGVVRDTTYNKNTVIMNNQLKPYFKNTSISKVNFNVVMKFRKHLIDKGLSNQRINAIIKFLKEVTNFANAIYETSYNPFRRIKPLAVEQKKEINFYTLDEYSKLDSVVDDIVYKMFFRFLYFSGLGKVKHQL
ncbi:MAG: hypothetical protein RR543_01470 [Erysipelotrichales bacterium]